MTNFILIMISFLMFSSCNINENIKNETMDNSFLNKVEGHLAQKNVSMKDYNRIEAFFNTDINEYIKEKCIRSSDYEQKICKNDVENSDEYKNLIKESKALPDIQQNTLLNQFKKERCVASSIFDECSKNLSINSRNFSHIKKDQKVTIVELENLYGTEWRYSKKVILVMDKNDTVIAFWEKKGFAN